MALQCSDLPIRLTGTFPPTATLTEVLLHFEQESDGALVIFGRKGQEAVLSVLGREFGISEGSGGGGATTLAGMGVGGNVLIRLGFRQIGSHTGGVVSSGSGTTASSARSPVQTVLPPPIPPPTTSLSATSTSHSTPVVTLPPQDDTLSALQPPSHDAMLVDAPVTPPIVESTESPSPPAVITPSPPPGPQNRNRIVYTAASASTPAAAKRTLIKLTI